MYSEQELFQVLQKLESVDGIRKLASALGYTYANQQVVLPDSEVTRGAGVTKIAEASTETPLPVLLVVVKKDVITDIDRGLQKYTRAVFNLLPANYKTSFLIITTDTYARWHFVYVKQLGKRNLFRRIIVGKNEKNRTAAERLAMIQLVPEDTYAHVVDKFEKAFDREALS
ncbi:MAG: hypothetical protein WC955_07080, partial [Elusimicrobiota bacterium]